MQKITVALTSCGRTDLLLETLDTFKTYNTYKNTEIFIMEDRNENSNLLEERLKSKHKDINFFITPSRLGQHGSIDLLYKKINTDLIFHCEDDWRFKKYGFIEKSIPLLESDEKLLQVHLRASHGINGHPVGDPYLINQERVRKLEYNFDKVWHGFSFNPGLRRKKDADLLGVFSNFRFEYQISEFYKKNNFYAIVLDDSDGYVEHIGYGHHVNDPTH
jgi:hypothetical protein